MLLDRLGSIACARRAAEWVRAAWPLLAEGWVSVVPRVAAAAAPMSSSRRAAALAPSVLVGALVLVMLAASPGLAWHRGGPHVVIGVGPYWWGPPYPYWWYAPYPVYAPPLPPVVIEEPPVYVQRPRVPDAPEGPYWYYCSSARAYYPGVAQCPEPWITVPPRPPQ